LLHNLFQEPLVSSAVHDFHHRRARLAGLSHHRGADDPELIAERRAVQEAAMLLAIKKALAKAPVTRELRARINDVIAEVAEL
jgi:hypothetical protein